MSKATKIISDIVKQNSDFAIYIRMSIENQDFYDKNTRDGQGISFGPHGVSPAQS